MPLLHLTKLRCMCLHSLLSLCDFSQRQTGAALAETLRRSFGNRTDIAQ